VKKLNDAYAGRNARLVLVEKGYGKDAAGIAADAITFGLHFITIISKHHFFSLLLSHFM